MALKNAKFDGNGGLWKAYHNSKIAAQGNIQIGGRVIALTIWVNNSHGHSPDYNITVNDQKTSFEDMLWFKSLSPLLVHAVPPKAPSNELIDAARGRDPVDDDIPF